MRKETVSVLRFRCNHNLKVVSEQYTHTFDTFLLFQLITTYIDAHVDNVRYIFNRRAALINPQKSSIKGVKGTTPPDINVTPILNFSSTCRCLVYVLPLLWSPIAPVVVAYRCTNVQDGSQIWEDEKSYYVPSKPQYI